MTRFPRLPLLAATLGLAGLVSMASPATAGHMRNALTTNALTTNALTTNALTTNILIGNAIIPNSLSMNARIDNTLIGNILIGNTLMGNAMAADDALAMLNGVTVEIAAVPTELPR